MLLFIHNLEKYSLRIWSPKRYMNHVILELILYRNCKLYLLFYFLIK